MTEVVIQTINCHFRRAIFAAIFLKNNCTSKAATQSYATKPELTVFFAKNPYNDEKDLFYTCLKRPEQNNSCNEHIIALAVTLFCLFLNVNLNFKLKHIDTFSCTR